jgi:hypothetical protein
MLTPDLITITPASTFSLVSTRATSSLRNDITQPLDEPRVLTVSHDVQKNGRVSSVVYIDDTQNVISSSTLPIASGVRVQLKLQYNPAEGRTDIAVTLAEIYGQLKEILDAGNFAKVLNKEH